MEFTVLRMMGFAEKLELKCEAVYQKARFVQGEYFDSISYRILREEWEIRNQSHFK